MHFYQHIALCGYGCSTCIFPRLRFLPVVFLAAGAARAPEKFDERMPARQISPPGNTGLASYDTMLLFLAPPMSLPFAVTQIGRAALRDE